MKTKEMILVGIFAALTAIGAFIKIPVPYVPFTLQFIFCAFSGILLGSKLGALSQLVYVAIGLTGIPVFTGGGGLSYIFKPSFGYLIGFIAAAFVIGKITEKVKDLNFIKLLLANFAGVLVIYLIGVPYLYIIFNFYMGKGLSIYAAVVSGAFNFIIVDIIKSVIVASIAVSVLPRLRKFI